MYETGGGSCVIRIYVTSLSHYYMNSIYNSIIIMNSSESQIQNGGWKPTNKKTSTPSRITPSSKRISVKRPTPLLYNQAQLHKIMSLFQ
jgi:hypothetical protein